MDEAKLQGIVRETPKATGYAWNDIGNAVIYFAGGIPPVEVARSTVQECTGTELVLRARDYVARYLKNGGHQL